MYTVCEEVNDDDDDDDDDEHQGCIESIKGGNLDAKIIPVS